MKTGMHIIPIPPQGLDTDEDTDRRGEQPSGRSGGRSLSRRTLWRQPPGSRRTLGRQSPPRALRSLLVGLLSVCAGLTVLPLHADAYTNTQAPYRPGPVQFTVGGGLTVGYPRYTVITPTLLVYSNGAVGTQQQEVTVAYELQRSAGGSNWATVASITVRDSTGPGLNGSAVIGSQYLSSPYGGVALFRIRTTVLWGGPAGPYLTGSTTGGQQWVTSSFADMSCSSSTCREDYAGTLTLWG